MKRYEIRTTAGGGLPSQILSLGAIKFALLIGGSITTYEIREQTYKIEKESSVFYTLYGVDFGLGVGASSYSQWTEIMSHGDIKDFEGYVTVVERSLQLPVKYRKDISWTEFIMQWVTGSAAGSKAICRLGWASGLKINFTGTHGFMRLRS